ncbi:MAG: hypothetical protein ABIN96_01860 [Rubrivivax sp.]
MARIAFRPIWTVTVQHGFFGGSCDALSFTVPPATERTLAGAHAVLRVLDGALHVLVEVDEANIPLSDLSGLRLLIALKPREASFDLITAPWFGVSGLPRGESAVWDNSANANALGAPRAVRISGEQLRIEPRAGERPLTLRLFDGAGTLRAQTVLNIGDEAWTLPGLYPHGEWRVEEQGAGPAASWALWVEPELVNAWGVLALGFDAGHLPAGQSFTLDFDARSDTLRYYVVASRFGNAEFNSLSVQDTGFAADARPAIVFKRVAPANFDASHLAPALLDPSGGARIALFEAQATVARRARGPVGLELHRNGDVLIGNLPQPGAERHDAQFVVHLSLS